MKLELTDRGIGNLSVAPGQANFEAFDTVTPGLILRIGKRSKTWSVRAVRNGSIARVAIGEWPDMKVARARVMAVDTIERVAKERSDPDATIGAVARRFKEQYLPDLRPSVQAEWGRLIEKEVLPVLDDVRPAETGPARKAVVEALDSIKQRSGYTANRTYEVVRRLIRWGISKSILDPVSGMVFEALERPMRTERVRTRVLSEKELVKLWHALEAEPFESRAFWRLSLWTGQRRGEVLAFGWDQLDTENWIWRFTVKGGKEQWLGLPTQAVTMLTQLRQFAGEQQPMPATVQKSTDRLRKKVGANFRPHDIRRTVGTMLGELEIRDEVVSRILAHSGVGARVTHQHYNLSKWVRPIREALQLWANHLDWIAASGRGPDR